MKVIRSSLEKERKWVTSFSLSIWTWVCFLKGEAGWASASHRPGLSSSEGFPGLVWWKRGLPSPESSCSLLFTLTTGPTSPHECGDAGPPLGLEPVVSGAFPAGADQTRGLPGPAWRPSPGDSRGNRTESRATLGDPGCAAAFGATRKALVALLSRVAGSGVEGGSSKPRGLYTGEELHARVSPLRPSTGSSFKSPKLLGIFVNYAETPHFPSRVHADPTPRRTGRRPHWSERSGGLPIGDLLGG